MDEEEARLLAAFQQAALPLAGWDVPHATSGARGIRNISNLFMALKWKLIIFNSNYRDHWILKYVVQHVTKHLVDWADATHHAFWTFADWYEVLEEETEDVDIAGAIGRFLEGIVHKWNDFIDNPLWWILDLLEGPFPDIRLWLPDPADYIRRKASGRLFPGLPYFDDWGDWWHAVLDYIMPGFWEFVDDPVDYLRRIFSEAVFPGMYVNPDWRRWVYDALDWMIPGIWKFFADPRGWVLRWVSDQLGVPFEFWEWPWQWVLYKVRNEIGERHDYFIAWLRSFGESVLRFMFEGVWG